jgi:hypothetical protein
MIRRVGALLLAGVATAMAQDGRVPAAMRGVELIEKALTAMGDAPAIDSVKSLELKGTGTRRVQGNDLPVTTVARYFFPDRSYQELILPMGTMKTVVGPKEAFIVAGEGALPLPDAERQALLKLMNRNLVAVLQARKRPTFSATVTGTGTVDGEAVELVQVETGSDTLTLAIDPASGLILQTTSESGGGASAKGTLVVTYSDHRKAGSLVYPFKAVGTFAGQPAFTSQLESVVTNPSFDEAMFQPPPPHSMFPGAEEQGLPPVPPAPSPAAPQATPAPAKPSPTPPPGE